MENLRFDFENGIIYRHIKKYHTYKIAGWKHPEGYMRIWINGKQLALHRFLYEMYHNIKLTPDQQIDHINNIKDDNRICNLRVVSHSQNQQNSFKYCNNTSGYKGIHWHKQHCKWQAYYHLNGKTHHIGYFVNIEDAKIAYNNKIRDLNENFGCYFKIN